MSTDRDTTRVVRSWLRSTEFHASADRVLDGLVVGLDTTPQHRATWWPVRRITDMNTYAKVGLAAAAVVVAALLGYTYLIAPNVGAPGIDDPTPSPSATTAPEAQPLPFTGSLDPGTYRVSEERWTPITADLQVPAGWTATDAGALAKNPDIDASVNVAFFVVTHVYGDACQSEGTLAEIGPSADDLVAALGAQDDIAASGPTDVTIDSRPAQRVDLSYPPGLDTSTCRNPGIGIQIWANETETDFFALANGYEASVYAVDVNDDRVVVTIDHGPDATDEDVAEAEEMVRSMRFPTEP